tara:strand:- start:3895 stop:4083 length:189 start_codon:yes stop_codon:yes gene_type:complete
MKSAKVTLTIEWEITNKEWLAQVEHMSEIDKLDNIITKDNVVHTLYALNDIAYPVVKKTSIK